MPRFQVAKIHYREHKPRFTLQDAKIHTTSSGEHAKPRRVGILGTTSYEVHTKISTKIQYAKIHTSSGALAKESQ